MSWWRKESKDSEPGEAQVHAEVAEDGPTGAISGAALAEIVATADAAAVDRAGTNSSGAASKPDVNVVAGAPATDSDGLEKARSDRRALIQLCLYALDRARSGGVVERIEEGLAAIGVYALRPDGERFDPSRHEAGGAVPTDDPAREGTVAETEVVGFVDDGTLLRAPIVTVYTRR